MRRVFDPKEPGFDQAVSNIIAEFAYIREHPDLMASFIEKTKLPLRL